VTVFGVIFIVFRSFRFGILTVVPNLLPVVAVLGVMGYLDISMNIATVMVASVALGVVDDDTIHFINRYRREVAAGATTDEAIERATAHEGRASLTTAFINSCGYAVLLMSEYRPTAWFGGLLALTMAVAFLAEVLILPATIKLLPRIFGADALRATRRRAAAAAACVLGLCFPAASHAQSLSKPSGHLSVTTAEAPSRDTLELRARAFVEEKADLSRQLRVTGSAFVEGLIRRHGEDESSTVTRDAIFKVHDAFIESTLGRLDLRIGLARIVWGRLDEVQPTDVVNPLDVSRFFFEGRSEARLPVALVRAQVFLSDRASLEGVYVPVFRRGRFDQLDEPSSPFTPRSGPADAIGGMCLAIGCPTLPPLVVDHEPPVTFDNAQGGARFNATTGRLDWSVSAFRGFEPFPVFEPGTPQPGAPLPIHGRHPRFTMLGGDFETVRGEWGIRGEVAAFVDDNFQASVLRPADGSSVDGGVGVDRRAGDYRISGTVLFHYEAIDLPIREPRSSLSWVLSADRRFSRERYAVRAFGVANTSEGSGFARLIATGEVRDNLALEGSIGWFVGEGRDLVGRFADSDFIYVRLKHYF
jgi:hypothetical protein